MAHAGRRPAGARVRLVTTLWEPGTVARLAIVPAMPILLAGPFFGPMPRALR